MTIKPNERLLSVKELADRLGRSERYVYRMKRKGFRMIGGRTTLAAALEWLEIQETPRNH